MDDIFDMLLLKQKQVEIGGAIWKHSVLQGKTNLNSNPISTTHTLYVNLSKQHKLTKYHLSHLYNASKAVSRLSWKLNELKDMTVPGRNKG